MKLHRILDKRDEVGPLRNDRDIGTVLFRDAGADGLTDAGNAIDSSDAFFILIQSGGI